MEQSLEIILLGVTLVVISVLFFAGHSSRKSMSLPEPMISRITERKSIRELQNILSSTDAVIYCPSKSIPYDGIDNLSILHANRSGHICVFVYNDMLVENLFMFSNTNWTHGFLDELADDAMWELSLSGIITPIITKLLIKWSQKKVIHEHPVFSIIRITDYNESSLGGNLAMRYQLIKERQGNEGDGLIPKLIVQTWVEYQTNVYYISQCQRRLLDLNPSYQYVMYDDCDMRRFIQHHYGRVYSTVYEQIEPGAYKSDFFRLLFLLKYGGIYCDISLFFETGFDNLLGLSQTSTSFVVPVDNQSGHLCLFNAFIMVSPNHPVIKENVRIVIDHVKKGLNPRKADSPEPCLYLTGPCSLGRAFLRINNSHSSIIPSDDGAFYDKVMLLKHIHPIQSIVSMDGLHKVATTRHRTRQALISSQMKNEVGKPHYSEYCRNNKWLMSDPVSMFQSNKLPQRR